MNNEKDENNVYFAFTTLLVNAHAQLLDFNAL